MKRHSMNLALMIACCAALVSLPAAAADSSVDKPVVVDGLEFASWSDYVTSDYFRQAGKHCGAPGPWDRGVPKTFGATTDCEGASTNANGTLASYDPGDTFLIPVVVHIIQSTGGQGQITDQMVQSQIDILNEDFMAQAGTPGSNGNVGGIQFALATQDPSGSPTNGILRYTNDSWFNDSGDYWTPNAWDTTRYLNIYTNTAGGNLGYVPNFPQWMTPGDPADRVVILWNAFGRNAPIGPPFDQGRTATHEVGHWMALEHTFNEDGVCGSASAPGCYTDGDLICDTNVELVSHDQVGSGCDAGYQSCSSVDPIDNYMDYSNDTCMEKFTVEQIRRMRCTLQNFRPNVYSVVSGTGEIFNDGFETGLGTWSGTGP